MTTNGIIIAAINDREDVETYDNLVELQFVLATTLAASPATIAGSSSVPSRISVASYMNMASNV